MSSVNPFSAFTETTSAVIVQEKTTHKIEDEGIHHPEEKNNESAKHELEFNASFRKHKVLQIYKENLFPSDYYWDALIKVGKGRREEAIELVNSAGTCDPLHSSFSWLEFKPDNIDAFFDKLFVDSLRRKPQLLNKLGLLESVGVTHHNQRLNDYSVDGKLADLENAKANLEILESFDFDNLTFDQQISYKVFQWQLKHAIEGEKFLFHEYIITQMYGVLSDITDTFTQVHQIKTGKDFNFYKNRLSEIPKQFAQVKAYMKLQWDKKIKLPKFCLQRLLDCIDSFIKIPINQNPFYTYCETKLDNINVNSEFSLDWLEHQMNSQIIPAYEDLRQFLLEMCLFTNTNHSVSTFPDGKEYYAYCLKHHTTTDLTPDDIYKLGIQEVSRIQKEMRVLLETVGIQDPRKGVGELMSRLGQDAIHYFPNTPAGRIECIQTFEHILQRSRSMLSGYFDVQPDTPVKIIPTPKYEEEGMPGAYYSEPSLDGSRLGTFYVNLRDMNEIPKYGMETLLVHEAEPGHHFQLTLQAQSDIPLLRKTSEFNAYVEGWALYTEKLAYEKGFFRTPLDKLGHLQDELLRAVRLIVDTGIHHKGWNIDYAVDYMRNKTGYNRKTVITEIERYFIYPGQACSYKIGQLKILELRQKSMDTLGEKFDIKEFHNVVLNVGGVPLAILEEVVNIYIQKNM